MSRIPLTARNATLEDLVPLLQAQADVKHDAVVPAEAIRSEGGVLRVAGMGPDGPVGAPGAFIPTEGMDGDVADKLGIPLAYVRRMRADRVDLYDANVNGWLHGYRTPEGVEPCENDPRYRAPDGRKFLFRTFVDHDGGPGIGRALLSDTFKAIDNLDVLLATLDGVREAGIEAHVVKADLTERRMSVKIAAPAIQAVAPLWLQGYRNPFPRDHWQRWAERHGVDPGSDGDAPIVFAGLRVSNSETGGSAFQVAPEVTTLICMNGQVRQADALRRVHLGARMDEGVVDWSSDTLEKNLELVKAQTRDAVQTFLSVSYLESVVAAVEAKTDVPLENPAEQVRIIAQRCRYTETQADGILAAFIKGGQLTAGGFMSAVSAYAQDVADPDVAFDLEASTFDALDHAAAVGSR